MKGKNILLEHGSGGKLSLDLIKELFVKHFNNPILQQQADSALLNTNSQHVAFTTDSYVVDPIFFPGGNIGKLAVCGTVNDLAVSGAVPRFISVSFIIEEGFSIEDLEQIVLGMAEEAKKASVQVVTGDTKVVNKGKCDRVFINTSGIGLLDYKFKHISTGSNINTGDRIILNGTIGDHGMAIMAARNFTSFNSDIKSDCASLNHMIKDILDSDCPIKFMRDATRGGIANLLCELTDNLGTGIEIDESKVPVKESVRGMCELLGFDPFYVANEGKVIIICSPDDADRVIEIMKTNEYGKNSSIIGEVTATKNGKTILKTEIGGKRIIEMMAGEQLPRIC